MKNIGFVILLFLIYNLLIFGQNNLNGYILPVKKNALDNIVINEFLADPGPSDGDANGDGIINSYEDEFIEIINFELIDIDISHYTISDATSVRHIFPPGTIIPCNQSIVVFGGGTPTGIPGIVQVASTGLLSLNNLYDDIIIKDTSGSWVTNFSYIQYADRDQSLALDPDISGTFKLHTEILSNPVPYSPGRWNINDIPATVEHLSYQPQKYELSQNYPNPFNPSTTIRWQIPESGFVTLKIYDVLVREVTTLVNEELNAGKHEIVFDAARFSSGIYFYQLLVSALQSKDGKAGEFTETKKMILIK